MCKSYFLGPLFFSSILCVEVFLYVKQQLHPNFESEVVFFKTYYYFLIRLNYLKKNLKEIKTRLNYNAQIKKTKMC